MPTRDGGVRELRPRRALRSPQILVNAADSEHGKKALNLAHSLPHARARGRRRYLDKSPDAGSSHRSARGDRRASRPLRAKMSALRRLSLASLRNLKTRAAGPKGGFWGEGHNTPGGNLFSESPPPAGQKRHWESWEAPWCAALLLPSSCLLLLARPRRRPRRPPPRSPPPLSTAAAQVLHLWRRDRDPLARPPRAPRLVSDLVGGPAGGRARRGAGVSAAPRSSGLSPLECCCYARIVALN